MRYSFQSTIQSGTFAVVPPDVGLTTVANVEEAMCQLNVSAITSTNNAWSFDITNTPVVVRGAWRYTQVGPATINFWLRGALSLMGLHWNIAGLTTITFVFSANFFGN